MEGKNYKLEIITPKKVVFSGDVESFTAPGVQGSFQVLINHAPLLAQVGIGEMIIRDAAGTVSRFATGGGFVEVSDNHVVMLAESAERPEEIDGSRAKAAKERAEARIAKHQAETDLDRARLALYRAINRLRIAQG
jgi:F-type H+-transporting ATPase subunit epsilon